uniref:Uncharacterized protein n=1 Tax=Solanum lycopersicum TaxID=4081 RepID=A0A3Q7EKI3_SOLLC
MQIWDSLRGDRASKHCETTMEQSVTWTSWQQVLLPASQQPLQSCHQQYHAVGCTQRHQHQRYHLEGYAVCLEHRGTRDRLTQNEILQEQMLDPNSQHPRIYTRPLHLHQVSDFK